MSREQTYLCCVNNYDELFVDTTDRGFVLFARDFDPKVCVPEADVRRLVDQLTEWLERYERLKPLEKQDVP